MVARAKSRAEKRRLEALAANRAALAKLTRSLVDDRKNRLAQLPEGLAGRASKGEEYLVFGAAGERFAISLLAVVEAVRRPRIAWVPGSPAVLRGLMNLRGHPLPVIDLCVLLGMSARTSPTANWVAVVGEGGGQFAILADEMPRVREIPLAGLGPAPIPDSSPAQALIRGVTADAVTVLAGDKLWNHPALQFEAFF